MRAYYNEHDPYAAQWLRNLMRSGAIPEGDVDERSIVDVSPDDVRGYRQCHWFAGIGGWPYALDLAGWGDRPVWTGSCPCQPFSAAGKRKAGDDERHLWPAWLRLIRECRPDTIIGEQVEGAVGLGWLDRVFADLENEGYACGAAVLGAHSVGAPHIRQRLFWMADADGRGAGNGQLQRGGQYRQQPQDGRDGGMADAGAPRRRALLGTVGTDGRPEIEPDRHGNIDRLGHAIGAGLEERASLGRDDGPERATAERTGGDAGGMANSIGAGHAAVQRGQPGEVPDGWACVGTSDGPERGGSNSGMGNAASVGRNACRDNRDAAERIEVAPRIAGASFWPSAEWLLCTDGKARRVPSLISGIQPLAARIPLAVDGLGPISRVGTLRGAGNAICPQVAAEFIKACFG
jgi:DNA (cytosine-5)-methyltransferase 1